MQGQIFGWSLLEERFGGQIIEEKTRSMLSYGDSRPSHDE
jgi:hypothetical protein